MKQSNNDADRYVQLKMDATGSRTVAQATSRSGLSPRRAPLYPRQSHVGFMVENVVLGQGFLRVIWLFPSLFHQWAIFIYSSIIEII
jgi:hypothetical protein